MTLADFLCLVAQIGANRSSSADWTLYERFKADLRRQFPDLPPQDYERAVNACARAAGV